MCTPADDPASLKRRDSAFLIENLLPILKKHKVALYLNGHDHCMQVIEKETDFGSITFVTSGAGSEVRALPRLAQHTLCKASEDASTDRRESMSADTSVPPGKLEKRHSGVEGHKFAAKKEQGGCSEGTRSPLPLQEGARVPPSYHRLDSFTWTGALA